MPQYLSRRQVFLVVGAFLIFIMGAVWYIFSGSAITDAHIPTKTDNATTILPSSTSAVTRTPTPNPTLISMPDLTIEQVTYVGSIPDCANNPQDAITVANIGTAAAGTFNVDISGGIVTVHGLGIGQSIVLYVYAQPSIIAIADPTDVIAESNKNNNSMKAILPIPTLAPTCTPSPEAPVLSTQAG